MSRSSAKRPIHEVVSGKLKMLVAGISKDQPADAKLVMSNLDTLILGDLKPEHARALIEEHKGLPALFTECGQADLVEFANEFLADLQTRGVDNPADDEAPDATLASSATGALVADEVQSTERETVTA